MIRNIKRAPDDKKEIKNTLIRLITNAHYLTIENDKIELCSQSEYIAPDKIDDLINFDDVMTTSVSSNGDTFMCTDLKGLINKFYK